MQAQGIAALAPGQAAPMQNPALRNQPSQGTNAALPPDLKQLLAQQSRNELAQAAQRYQALQQALQLGRGQGKPPTVAQQVQMQGQRERAAVAGPAMQTQEMQKQAGLKQLMQSQRGVPEDTRQPERQPTPEDSGIAQLPVPEFGMAGGGIVAFSGAEGSWIEPEDIRSPVDVNTVVRQLFVSGVDPEARNKALTALANNYGADKVDAAVQATYANMYQPKQQAPMGVPMAPPRIPQQEPESPVRAPLEKSIIDSLGFDPYARAVEGVGKMREQMGLEAILKQQQEIIDERKERQAAAAQGRLPALYWGLLGAKDTPGGGLGSIGASVVAGAEKAQQGYAAADEANAEAIDALRMKALEAQRLGNMEAAKQYGSLLERSLMGIGQAQQSGVGLLTKDEATAQRREATQGRLEEMRFRNQQLEQQAAERGDLKLADQLRQAYSSAEREATARAKAEEAAKGPLAKLDSPQVQARAAQYLEQILANNPVYQRGLQKYMGAMYQAPKATQDPMATLQSQAQAILNSRMKGK